MIRSVLLSTVAMSLAFAVGCNKAADEQRKADEARAEANEKIVEANNEATKKINYAESQADEKVAEAQASFLKMREDFRHDMNEKVVELDKDIAELEAKAKTATGKAKADLDARLPQIRTQREAFAADYKTVDGATAVTWDGTKQRLEKEWKELKDAVDKAD
jgi:hypothetical protein